MEETKHSGDTVRRDELVTLGVPKEVLDAVIPQVRHVGKIALQPISALHYIALVRFAPQALRGGNLPELDLLRALLICSLTSAQLSELLKRPEAVDVEAMKLGAAMSLADLMSAAQTLSAHLEAQFEAALQPKSDGEKKTESAGS